MLSIREASTEDVPAIVALLANDPLGKTREVASDPLPMEYFTAFFCIERDQNQNLVVAELDGVIVGTLQLFFLPHLTYKGGWRAQIEAVRVAPDARGSGVGGELIRWAIAESRSAGCHLVQLTTDAKRPEALNFYKKHGFEVSHKGLKLHLNTKKN